jgi:hypothetical protein
MSSSVARTQPCGKAQARTRLADAHAQLELAGLANAASSPEERKAAVACAVVAGIAAADAACCAVLSTRSRSQNHRDAADLLQTIDPGGTAAAKQFRRLIGLKDAAQYGFDDISGQALVAAQRQARSLVEFAERMVAR